MKLKCLNWSSFVNRNENRKRNDFLGTDSGIKTLLSMYGTTWLCDSYCSTVLFMKSKYRSSICNEELGSKLRGIVSIKCMVAFKDLIPKKYEIY